jgi:putative membrane protein
VAPSPATPDEPHSNPPGDSSQMRDQLANERTYLAWLRTSIAMMALGLAAAKFGSPSLVFALSACGVLVATAIAVFGYATVRYRAVCAEIARGRSTIRVRGPITAAVGVVLTVIVALVLLIR